jgi:hypothetical protein
MAIYLRKSIRVGPLRFNLSKSGVGVSAGIKGFRVGTGPRGNYVHMGRGGIYYRATIPSSSPASSTPASPRVPSPATSDPIIPTGTHAPLEEIVSADPTEVTDSSSKELLDEINKKNSRPAYWKFCAGSIGVVLLLALTTSAWGWMLRPAVLVGVPLIYAVWTLDRLKKSTVLFYELDETVEPHYAAMLDGLKKMADCSAAWYIHSQGKVHDSKYHAGAGSLVTRKECRISLEEPAYVKTNVAVYCIALGKQKLYFFPDRVFLYSQSSVGALTYESLSIAVKETRFIEDGSPPRDAQVVDRTWRYVNKKGGPDKRFKDNREMPVCLYDEVLLSSNTGLNAVLNLSRHNTAPEFATSVRSMISALPSERAFQIKSA